MCPGISPYTKIWRFYFRSVELEAKIEKQNRNPWVAELNLGVNRDTMWGEGRGAGGNCAPVGRAVVSPWPVCQGSCQHLSASGSSPMRFRSSHVCSPRLSLGVHTVKHKKTGFKQIPPRQRFIWILKLRKLCDSLSLLVLFIDLLTYFYYFDVGEGIQSYKCKCLLPLNITASMKPFY